MIIGLGGIGQGIAPVQKEALRHFLQKTPIEVAIHRGCGGMESMIHNVIRSVYPHIPVHVIPIIGRFCSICSMPLPQFPQTICYEPGTPSEVHNAIIKCVSGIVFLPYEMRDGGPGWELPYKAAEQAVPVLFIWPNGKLTLETNEL